MATRFELKTHENGAYADKNPPERAADFAAEVDQRARDDEQRLLLAVEDLSPLLANGAAQSDNDGHLVAESAKALRSSGLWRMRLCRELGGLELPIAAQIRILSALAAADTASAWCTMVVNNAVAVVGGTMPDAAIERTFASGVPSCSIVASPGGVATAVDGGYILNGTWRLATGIHHAEWVHATAYIDRDPSRLLPFVAPVRDVELLDTWTVVGLGGTGSVDFSLKDYFLPAQLCGFEDDSFRQVRGNRRYDLIALQCVVSYEHVAFALGVARRALHELRDLLTRPPAGKCLVDREVVQSQFGQQVVKWRALQALSDSFFSRVDSAALLRPATWPEQDRHFPRALGAWATQLALECVEFAFNRAGFAALRRESIFEKLLRDMNVAAAHVAVEDSAFPLYALDLIEASSAFEWPLT